MPFKNKATLQLHAGVIRKCKLVIGEKISEEIVGYVAHLELVNGFSKTIYMSKAEMESHAQTYSQSYAADKKKTWSMWAKNFNQMAIKTILKK